MHTRDKNVVINVDVFKFNYSFLCVFDLILLLYKVV